MRRDTEDLQKSSQTKFPFFVVYWGNKGGGLRFIKEFIDSISDDFDEVHLSVSENVLSQLSQLPIRLINVKHNETTSLLQYLSYRIKRSYRNEAREIINICHSNKLDKAVVLMPFFGDQILNQLLKKGIKLFRVIHDPKRHPGELWPNFFYYRKVFHKSELILLSKYSFEAVKHTKKHLASLARKRNTCTKKPILGVPENFALYIGRNRKYKNMKIVTKLANEAPDISFVFAMRGLRLKSKPSNVHVIDRWLNEGEVEYLISKARVVLALYREASQSGIVEQALYWRTPCLVSQVGALPEQVLQQELDNLATTKNIPELSQKLRKLMQVDKSSVAKYSPSKVLSEVLLDLEKAGS